MSLSLIEAGISRARTTLALLVLIFVAGTVAYLNIPKESYPDINIPIIYVSLHLEGISPEDAERLLIRPMEQELKSIEGIKEMRATSYEGGGFVLLEFDAGFDPDDALDDVREKVDIAKVEIPNEADEPRVTEVNFSLFPILNVVLSGNVPERQLVKVARDLRDKIETIPEVLDVEISGDREEQVEIVIDPVKLEGYGINTTEAIQFTQRSNRLIAAGSMDTGAGRFAIKVPGLLETVEDIAKQPLKVNGDAVIKVQDIATIQRNFKDPESIARFKGRPAVVLEVSKRTGRNIIDTIDKVRQLVGEEQKFWPDNLRVDFLQDQSDQIKTRLSDLQNNVMSAILLVMIVILAALGWRSAALVGIAIPGSFLLGMLVLSWMGITVNVVVLFSLILAVGMLVDGAIVVVEYADREMRIGHSRYEAYVTASRRMAWPIIASTATTLAAFFPLLFWPGTVGEFMKFMPITLLATLTASLFMALLFVPCLGTFFGKPQKILDDDHQEGAFAHAYRRVLEWCLRRPGKLLLASLVLLISVFIIYGKFGRGVEFFPTIEPDNAVILVHARGNLSVYERDDLMRQVETEILKIPEFKGVYTTTKASSFTGGQDLAEDVIGTIQLEFIDWQKRRKADVILKDILRRTEKIPGIIVEPQKQKEGPESGKPIQLQLSARSPEMLLSATKILRHAINQIPGLMNVEDSSPIPGIEWKLTVDRAQAAKFAVDVTTIGQNIRMITNGVMIDEYRPDDSDDEIDILVRLPKDYRNLDQLDAVRIQTNQGLVPISNFITRSAEQTVGRLNRVDGKRVMTIKADIEPGILADDKVKEIRALLPKLELPSEIRVEFKGEDEEQKKSQRFLSRAFLMALAIMALILVTQFNSFYSAGLILFAVILSTIGVFLGLLITGQAFGIVMGGVGVIALAGIVVNNNIVLIDTFDVLRDEYKNKTDAIIETGAQRLRPVMLTTITTILGLIPMVLQLNIDFLGRSVSQGAPSTQWWVQLASSIAFGLTFATILTLIITPCALQFRENIGNFFRNRRKRRAEN